MPIRKPMIWRNLLFCYIIHMWIPGLVRGQFITLNSIEIFTKHDWFKLKHTVYFQCNGENKTVLPGVTKTGVLYTFRGQESWQPMTGIGGEKCKRCGIYEQGSLVSDKEFDVWEVCPTDFSASQVYMHFKEKEINATFVCHGCAKFHSVSSKAVAASSPQEEGYNGLTVMIAIIAGVLCTTLVVVGGVFMFKHTQRMKKQRDQARFMQLFEESDEPEDELGLDPVI
ncbi:unnamed protein product [Arabidopsis thaliana]|uniref:DUF7953 domain-containing protein n=1 Tax=Arabidopsis thaliana TaxID=3702 RepID=A0A654FXU8_ARATH|nr:unnamed protein product [Arabidopsis thaliana]